MRKRQNCSTKSWEFPNEWKTKIKSLISASPHYMEVWIIQLAHMDSVIALKCTIVQKKIFRWNAKNESHPPKMLNSMRRRVGTMHLHKMATTAAVTILSESISLRMRDYSRNEISAKWLRLWDAVIQSDYLCNVDETIWNAFATIDSNSALQFQWWTKFNTKQYCCVHTSNMMELQFGYTVCDWFVNEILTINDKPHTPNLRAAFNINVDCQL